MSNIIPPMISSSPPPVDEQMDDDDEDDEFGDFRVADISLNLSALNTQTDSADSPEPWVRPKSPTISSPSVTPDSPLSPSRHKMANGIGPGPPCVEPADVTIISSCDTPMTPGCEPNSDDRTEEQVLCSDEFKSDLGINQAVEDLHLPSFNEDFDNHNEDNDDRGGKDVEVEESQLDMPEFPTIDTCDVEFPSISDPVISKENESIILVSDSEKGEEWSNFADQLDKPETNTVNSEHEHDEGTFDEFVSAPDQSESFAAFPTDNVASEEVVNFAAFPKQVDDDDEFQDFASPCLDNKALNVSTSSSAFAVVDDFDDFESAAFQSVSHQVVEAESYDDTVKKMFESFDSPEQPTEVQTGCLSQCLDDSSSVWGHLKELEASHALLYQWTSSVANQTLLSSLNIDSRNILYGPRWNSSVPRFAANLGFSPLEPVKATEAPPPVARPLQTEVKPVIEDAVPAAQFDWNSSGLTNPLDCVEQENKVPASEQPQPAEDTTSRRKAPVMKTRAELSVEACNVVDSFPDLSFLSARKLMCVANQNYERFNTRTRP